MSVSQGAKMQANPNNSIANDVQFLMAQHTGMLVRVCTANDPIKASERLTPLWLYVQEHGMDISMCAAED